MVENYITFKSSPEGHMVLDVLNRSPNIFGREIYRRCNGEIKLGSLYGLLGKLSDSGLLCSEEIKDPSSSGRPRVQWHLTEAGEQALTFLNSMRKSRAQSLSQCRKRLASEDGAIANAVL